ncbi:PspC domain-containing protein [Hydrogenophaga sp.]|uniref:PspC domain-containing protein n=1 Tax=Hydrogenophaga sp. TaxID=1904254 RepID=UPI0026387732|nr:PspC domain-containing protein [Hydrogenophaga sp.]MDM7950453.1 PspC domain-containing protein [Hydrogenophaga sp.]
MSLADELIKLEQLRERGTLSVEEFDRAKARLLNPDPVPAAPSDLARAINRLRRSGSDRWIAGVCGGLTLATGVESWVWRLLMVALAFAGGLGVALYALLWIFVPAD